MLTRMLAAIVIALGLAGGILVLNAAWAAGAAQAAPVAGGLRQVVTGTQLIYLPIFRRSEVRADFTAEPRLGPAPLVVTFTNLTLGTLTGSLWNFGDGLGATQHNPTHTYEHAGIYTVTLIVSTTDGAGQLTRPAYIIVGEPITSLQADFTATPLSGTAPLTVNFTNLSTPDGAYTASWWDFGDEHTSAETHPVNRYDEPGKYTVTLTVSNAVASSTKTVIDYIEVTIGAPTCTLTADFTAIPTSGTAPLTVTFPNRSSGPYTDSLWRFGDYPTSTSTLTDPIYTYTKIGTFTVTLTVSNAACSAALARPITVTLPPTGPVADFVAAPVSGPAPLTVIFTNTSSNYTDSLWNFGDGYLTTTQHPVHTYHLTGAYTVSLRVTNGLTFDDEIKTEYIRVGITDTSPICDGGFELDTFCWELPLTEYPAAINTERPHTGLRSLRTGIVNPFDNRYSYSSGRQTVYIPAETVSATLRFWLYPLSAEWPALARPVEPLKTTREHALWYGDAQYVLILDPTTEFILGRLVDQRSNAGVWRYHEFDLTPYAGRWIKLYFGVYNNGWGGHTAMYVDDVSLSLIRASVAGVARRHADAP